MGQLVSIAGARECPGKTLLGLNLAIAISNQIKEKTAFLDLSFSGGDDLEVLLNMRCGKTIESIVRVLPNMNVALVSGYLPEYRASVGVLSGMANEAKQKIDVSAMVDAVRMIVSVYPYTIVSLPDSFDSYLLSLLGVSNLVLFSLMPNVMSLNQARLFTDTLKRAYFPLSMLKTVVNTVDSKSALDNNKIQEYLEVEVCCEIPYDSETIFASINSGVPAVVYSPTCGFTAGVNHLSKILQEPRMYEGAKRTGVGANAELSVKDARPQDVDSERKIQRIALKRKIHKQLIEELNLKRVNLKDFTASSDRMREVREISRNILQGLLAKNDNGYERHERAVLIDEMLDEVLGLGCIEIFLKDPEITEVMVNGADAIYVEKKGKLTLTDLSFTSNEQLMTIIDRIVSPLGRRIDESSPLVDARLPDGSRVNAVIPPLSLAGPSITIRKFSQKKLGVEDLIKFGAITPGMAEFMRICVQLRKNIVVSGGTGSGKTTLLNVIASFIPEDERIVTIEDSAELKLPQKHVVRLEARPASIEGKGEINIRRLVINALRMRPDRIVVGECRGSETLDMLQAMNTGHDGSLTTIHSNSPKDGVSRITTMVMMAGMDLPEKAIREQIASAVNIIVQLSRQSDGTRKIVEITELTGFKDGEVHLMPIFKYEQTGLKAGVVEGRFVSTGNRPSFINEIDTHGLTINKDIFNEERIQ